MCLMTSETIPSNGDALKEEGRSGRMLKQEKL